MRGKIIVIEGTDCSGKETQTKRLIEKLNSMHIKCRRFSFPFYDTPTGKIIGGPYLGKPQIGECIFEEGAVNVDPFVASLYFAADRKYNIEKILKCLSEGYNVILDRYMYSNMAHQGGKIKEKSERYKMYKWIETLEFSLLKLPEADIKVFLHMPTEVSLKLKENRSEAADEHEKSISHLKCAETAYVEISELYDFKTIECSEMNKPRSVDDINNELFEIVKKVL